MYICIKYIHTHIYKYYKDRHTHTYTHTVPHFLCLFDIKIQFCVSHIQTGNKNRQSTSKEAGGGGNKNKKRYLLNCRGRRLKKLNIINNKINSQEVVGAVYFVVEG